ncbi:MAG: rhodanese-like domain-containing protein [Desulfitobacteriaceae bacterium]|nr:rhodanese-like domain-containing protein [Desulfitobacteriaceae bacterium]
MIISKTKWLALLLVGVMLSAFAVGCGTSDSSTTTAPANNPTTQQAVTIQQVADKYYAEMGADVYKISEADLKAKVDANDKNILIVDVRKAEDYAKSHIKGAVNVPFAKVNEYLDKLPVDKDLIVYCYTGQTAGQTVAIMNMYGLKAKSLNLGFDSGWVGKNNFPADTTPNQLPANVTAAKPDAAIAKILKDYFVNLPAHSYKINSNDLQALIEKGDNIQIVDLRSAQDFAKGHVKGAINIPFKEVNKHFTEFAKDKPVFVYCYTGQTAGQTVAVLNVLGINARSVHAGWDLGWMADKMPVDQ